MSSVKSAPNSCDAAECETIKGVIVGVKLVSGHRMPIAGGRVSDEECGDRIGLVVTQLSVKLHKLRALMVTQIPQKILPEKFTFLTAKRYPVSREQEKEIRLRSIVDDEPVVSIRKIFDNEPFGIRGTNGIAIGIVFTDQNNTADELRALIDSTAIFPGPLTADDIDSYQFAYRDDIPIVTRQECTLTVSDLSRNGTVTIIPVYRRPNTEIVVSEAQSSTTLAVESDSTPQCSTTSGHYCRARSVIEAPINTANNYVLISYVRHESHERAVQMQRALMAMAVTAVLDANDIPTSAHSDHTSNHSIRDCRLFVALVTHSYGTTQSTLRQLRLAFQMGVRVLPINFIPHYPPQSVAIYLSNVHHYTPAGADQRPDYWDQSFAEPTAREIACIYKQEISKARPAVSHADRHMTTGHRQSYDFQSVGPPVEPTKQLVVISAHPSLNGLVELIKRAFRRLDIDACSSTDICVNEPKLRRSRTVVQSETTTTDHEFRHAMLNNAVASPYVRQRFGLMTAGGHQSRAEKENAFLENAVKADTMVVLVSKEYLKSNTSKQQAFYGGLRDRVLAVLYDTSESSPQWMANFDRSMTRRARETDEQLTQRIIETVRAMTGRSRPADDRRRLMVASVILRNVVDVSDRKSLFVYFRGSDRASNPLSEQLCAAIGQALASVSNVILVTDGFSVESEIVSKSFMETRNSSSDLYRVLSESVQSEAMLSEKVIRVNGSDEDVVRAVAAMFDACVLVVDLPRSERIAQLFARNEKIVAQVVGDSDVGRAVDNVVELVTRRSRSKPVVCLENNTSKA